MHGNREWKIKAEIFSGKRGDVRLLLRTVNPAEVDLEMNLQSRVHACMLDPSLLAMTDREQIEESARQLYAKYALVTAAPDNGFILRNIRSQGFEIIAPDSSMAVWTAMC